MRNPLTSRGRGRIPRRPQSSCLQLLSLEDRLPPGDAFCGAAAAAALLGPSLRRSEPAVPASPSVTEFAPELFAAPFTDRETRREANDYSRRPWDRPAQLASLRAARAAAFDEDRLATLTSAVARVSRSQGASDVLSAPAATRLEFVPGAVDADALWVASALTKVNAAGTALLFSTYLGGRQSDHGSGIAVDAVGNVYVAGWSGSDDFPTTWGAFQPTHGGGDCDSYFGCADAFMARIAG